LKINISEYRYKLWLKFFYSESPKIQAGTYTVDIPTEFRSFLQNTIKNPTYSDLTITILPGWNMYDIDEYLSSKKILAPGAFLLAARDNFEAFQKKYSFLDGVTSLEGFLYPDTYRILPTADAYMILERLLTEWNAKIYPSYKKLGAL
jgi:cell division protein YceG involved in septum cleavage